MAEAHLCADYPEAHLTRSPEGTLYRIPEDGKTFMSTEVEMQEFLYGLVRYLKPELVFESGACHGYGAMALGLACQFNGFGNVVSYETDAGLVKIAKETCSHLPCVEIRQGDSTLAPELRQADFIFSDSTYEARIQEFALAKQGAVYVVHDTRLYPDLGQFVRDQGGTAFDRGRGFGVILKR